MKIRLVGAKLFYVEVWMDEKKDKQIDTANLIVSFRNSADAPKNNCVYVSMTTPHFSPSPNDVPFYPAPRSKPGFKS
jgi:hypothetical protein